VLLPLAASSRSRWTGGWATFWHAITARRRRALRSRSRLARRRARQRRRRHDHRVGARARRLPRQAARQRGHRPAVRAADDRRRPDAARALRARNSPSASTSPTRGGVVLALLFVTLPFVVRTVQPVLLELDREMEEAAASLGASRFTTSGASSCRTCLPAILSGVALAFARAVGEFGSTRAHLGQPAVQDRGRVGLHLRPGSRATTRPAPRRSRSCCSRSRSRAARDRRARAARDEA
jgi:hypothetical protein